MKISDRIIQQEVCYGTGIETHYKNGTLEKVF